MECGSAYREVARDCLVNFYGMSTAEATAVSESETIEALEKGSGNRQGVGAMASVDAALAAIVVRLAMDPKHAEKFREAIINGPDDCGVLKQAREEALVISNEENFELLALSYIHNSWVKENAKLEKIESKKDLGRLHQYAPIELIGFNELKKDLIFLNPLLDRLGIHVDLGKLEEEYNKRAQQFCEEHGLHSVADVEEYIASGEYLEECGVDKKMIDALTKESAITTEHIVSNLKVSDSPITFSDEKTM